MLQGFDTQDVNISPGAGGAIILNGIRWPTSDGAPGEVLVTNGSGDLEFSSAPASVTRIEVAASQNIAENVAVVAVTADAAMTLTLPDVALHPSGTPILFSKETGGGQDVTVVPF
ncbi:unnamed protein product, partial [Chrysoparadoxa australica]